MTALTRLIASTPFRLTVAYMGSFILAAALIVGFVSWRANDLLTSKAVEALTAEVAALRRQFEVHGVSGLATAINERVAEPGSNLYLLVDLANHKLAGNLSALPPELARDGQGGVFSYLRGSESGSRLPSRLAVGIPLAVAGGLTLVVGRDIEDQRQFAATIGRVALWSVGLLSALGVGAGILISRSVLGRIEAITDTSRKIMAGDLTGRVPLSGSGDELDRLSESLNAMLGRIEDLVRALREVSDNIAHDLRTPLNRLRNRAEAALRDSAGPDAYRDGLLKAMEEADELIKTFNALLLIARLEGGAVAESLSQEDPATIVADVAELYEPFAEDAGMAITVSVQQGLSLRINRELVSQAVVNMVDNAIKYTAGESAAPEAGATQSAVEVSVQAVGDAVAIAVADRGPGIAPQDRERALQRFVRLEKSRTLPGAGLGLSLVAAVARLHNGTVRLEDNAPGLRVVLTLPVRGPAHALPRPAPPERTVVPPT